MMRVNHSCEPNEGMGGNVLLVSMREIAAGEELNIDYALFLGDPGFAMDCRSGTAACRGVVRGRTGGAPTCGSATGDGFPGGSSRRSRKPGTTELIAPGEERRTGISARSVSAAGEFERRCQGTPVAPAGCSCTWSRLQP
jgi:hypothetical protein